MKNSTVFINSHKSYYALDEMVDNMYYQDKIIAIDTEFDRRRTYFPRLSLIQISNNSQTLVIDALAIPDLSKLSKLLFNNNILKIFHAPRQDLEIFFQLFKSVPENIFDTQIAAKLCGIDRQASYLMLCEQILHVNLSKTYQASHWLKRPLNPEMIQYAVNDVKHLIPLYQYLSNKLKQLNLEYAFKKEINYFTNIKNYKIDLDSAWKKVNFTYKSIQYIEIMKIIAAFRENYAIQLNIPRNQFATDKNLVAICTKLPTNKLELNRIKNLSLYLKSEKYQEKLFILCTGIKEHLLYN